MNSLNLILMWHMHQPDYRDHETGEFLLPWVYLHAIKDYTDMAYHLEKHPRVKAVINFVPILLEQLEDYSDQFLQETLRDPLLRLLITPDLNLISLEDRMFILNQCFQSNHDTMLKPYRAYQHLRDIYETLIGNGDAEMSYVSGQYLADLLTWYHLAWTGESVRKNCELVGKLMQQGKSFTYSDRKQLFELIGTLIQDLISRYRKLAVSGQIELSTTPHYHPLSPLLIDFNSAYDSLPDAVLPSSSDYPGGRDRVAYHLELAKESHKQRFHSYPFGVWPAEGGISKDFVEILAASELKWTASGEGVLAQSLHKSYPDKQLPGRNEYLYRAYKVLTNKEDVICFFRDDKLSDMIGFEYAKWYGRDAAENFVHSLERIHHEVKDAEDPVVTIILDGENAWESYPYNGYYFLNDLYEMIGNHLAIKTSTFRDYLVHLKESDTEAVFLPNLAAGSWVYGNFSTWIGSHDKNLAWDILCKAKQSYDAVLKIGNLTDEEQAAAKRQLASCESSDWFWWFGDYNSSQAVASFDRLFRKNLANLYSLLKQPIPSELSEPISYGNSNARMIETMRRSN